MPGIDMRKVKVREVTGKIGKGLLEEISGLLAEATKAYAVREEGFSPEEAKTMVNDPWGKAGRKAEVKSSEEKGGRIFVARQGNKILGFARLTPVADAPTGKFRYLDEIAVEKEFHNQGIGTKLMFKIADACGKEGVELGFGTGATGHRVHYGRKRIRALEPEPRPWRRKKLKRHRKG